MKPQSDKHTEANKRQEVYDSLTIQQKIDKLDQKYGKNLGAVRQRKRLEKELQKVKTNG